MPEPPPQHDPAALARAVPGHQLGAALSGGIGMAYLDLPGRPDDGPELAGAAAIKSPGRPVAGMERIIPGVPSRLRATPPPDDGGEPDRGHVRDGFRQPDVMKTVAPPTTDWWD